MGWAQLHQRAAGREHGEDRDMGENGTAGVLRLLGSPCLIKAHTCQQGPTSALKLVAEQTF